MQLTHVLGSTLYFPFSLFPCNLLTYYMLQCALHTMFYYVPALLSRLFSLTHSYTVFSTGNFQFSICFSATHSYTMFHNVHFTLCSTVCRSDFLGFSVQLTHIFFFLHCAFLIFCFSVQLNKHTVFYNMHFTLCSTVCWSDFLGFSVQLTHILGSTLCISHFLFFSATQ